MSGHNEDPDCLCEKVVVYTKYPADYCSSIASDKSKRDKGPAPLCNDATVQTVEDEIINKELEEAFRAISAAKRAQREKFCRDQRPGPVEPPPVSEEAPRFRDYDCEYQNRADTYQTGPYRGEAYASRPPLPRYDSCRDGPPKQRGYYDNERIPSRPLSRRESFENSQVPGFQIIPPSSHLSRRCSCENRLPGYQPDQGILPYPLSNQPSRQPSCEHYQDGYNQEQAIPSAMKQSYNGSKYASKTVSIPTSRRESVGNYRDVCSREPPSFRPMTPRDVSRRSSCDVFVDASQCDFRYDTCVSTAKDSQPTRPVCRDAETFTIQEAMTQTYEPNENCDVSTFTQDKCVEEAIERCRSQLPCKVGDQVPSKGGEQVPCRCGGQVPSRGGDQVPSRGGEQVPSRGGGQVPSRGGEQVPSRGGGQVPSRGGEQMPCRCGEQMPCRCGDQVPSRGGDQVLERCEAGDEMNEVYENCRCLEGNTTSIIVTRKPNMEVCADLEETWTHCCPNKQCKRRNENERSYPPSRPPMQAPSQNPNDASRRGYTAQSSRQASAQNMRNITIYNGNNKSQRNSLSGYEIESENVKASFVQFERMNDPNSSSRRASGTYIEPDNAPRGSTKVSRRTSKPEVENQNNKEPRSQRTPRNMNEEVEYYRATPKTPRSQKTSRRWSETEEAHSVRGTPRHMNEEVEYYKPTPKYSRRGTDERLKQPPRGNDGALCDRDNEVVCKIVIESSPNTCVQTCDASSCYGEDMS